MTFPEVLQDRREGSATFGAVAVRLPETSPLGDYGVFQPGTDAQPLRAGGNFVPASRVADWTVLTEGAE